MIKVHFFFQLLFICILMQWPEWSNILGKCNPILSEMQKELNPNELRKINFKYSTGLQEWKCISRDGLLFQNSALGNKYWVVTTHLFASHSPPTNNRCLWLQSQQTSSMFVHSTCILEGQNPVPFTPSSRQTQKHGCEGLKMWNVTMLWHWSNKELKSVTDEVLDNGLTSKLPVVP